jgi:hypothetical protein
MFDCQPMKWQDDFTQHKGLLTDFDLEVVMRYFRNREKIALRLEEENRKCQKLDSEAKKRSGNGNHANGNRPHSGGGFGGKRTKRNPNAPCHEHPGSGHLWKDCFKNPDNPNGYEAKAKAKAAKAASNKGGKKSDGHVAEVVANAVLDDGHVAEVVGDSNVTHIPLSSLNNEELEALIDEEAAFKLFDGVMNTSKGSFTCDEIIVIDTCVHEVLSHKHCANLHSFAVEQTIRNEEHGSLLSLCCKIMLTCVRRPTFQVVMNLI